MDAACHVSPPRGLSGLWVPELHGDRSAHDLGYSGARRRTGCWRKEEIGRAGRKPVTIGGNGVDTNEPYASKRVRGGNRKCRGTCATTLVEARATAVRSVVRQLAGVAPHRHMACVPRRSTRRKMVYRALIDQLRDNNRRPEPERENEPERPAEKRRAHARIVGTVYGVPQELRGRHRCLRSHRSRSFAHCCDPSISLTRSRETVILRAVNTLSQRALV